MGRKIRIPIPGPPFLIGKKSPLRMILLIFQENHMDQGAQKMKNVLQPVPVRRFKFPDKGVPGKGFCGNLYCRGILTKAWHFACYCDVGFEDKFIVHQIPTPTIFCTFYKSGPKKPWQPQAWQDLMRFSPPDFSLLSPDFRGLVLLNCT